jgi:hypothetical protein
MVGVQFDESLASLPAVKPVAERMVWGEQIDKSYDRLQPMAGANTSKLLATTLPSISGCR